MKKISLIFVFVLVLELSFSQVTYANMAKPRASDIGSSITFEKNDTISVVSEVLDITVNGSKANIVATYRMKNTTNEYISTQSMFLSPNIEDSGVKVTVNDKDISFMAESYELNYDTQIKTDDWKYILLKNNETGYYDIQNTVDTITFDMHFEPNEEYSVVVS